MPQSRDTSLRHLDEVIAACKACPLNDGYHLPVPGIGDINPDLMIIAEAPGDTESNPKLFEPGDKYGVPLIGEAGSALQDEMYALGFAAYSMYITNVVKHRPPKNRPPSEVEKSVCSTFLRRQLEIVKPPVIICLGKHASEVIRSIAGLSALEPTEPARGKHYTFTNPLYNIAPIQVFNLYHPSYALLRAPHKRPDLISDLRNVLEYLRGD